MILTILGGGGFRVPLVYSALLADTSPGRVHEVRLFDTNSARMNAVAAVCREQAASHARPPKVVLHTDLTEAVRGADFVFSAIRVGGLAGRRCDEMIPLKHHVIGQETVGAGGIAYGLRTLPVVTQIARVIAEVAPQAWVINFTNPAGMVTEALTPILGDRVIGICDSPVGLARRAIQAAGVPADRASDVEIDYVGLNHLGWLRSLRLEGNDLLPDLLADHARLGTFEEGRLFGAQWLSALGDLPNEYLHHYYFAREELAAAQAAEASRAEVIADQQQGFYGVEDADAPGAQHRWDEVRLARERSYMATSRDFERDPADLAGGGYDEVALAIMHAIAQDRPATLILNRPNAGRVAELDDEAIIEAPCRVDGAGVRPLPNVGLPDHGVGLVTTIKNVERTTIAAAARSNATLAWRAMAAHPLVDSVAVARRILDEMRRDSPGLDYLR